VKLANKFGNILFLFPVL